MILKIAFLILFSDFTKDTSKSDLLLILFKIKSFLLRGCLKV